MIDTLIVGGGPAGLTAAIYAARFLLNATLVDAGASRCSLIPLTRNHAGFPYGVSGTELLQRMAEQARRYGAKLVSGQVEALERIDGGFRARFGDASLETRTVLLATGVRNRRPSIDAEVHDRALASGRLRYCPVCDGYEVTDQPVAVVGQGARAAREAEFLLSYTAQVSFIPAGAEDGLSPQERERLDALGVQRLAGPAQDFRLEPDGLSLACGDGRRTFASVYPSLGSDVHSDLARALGAAVTDDGCIRVDAHQRTSVEGLYAAGDVVLGLDQISHAMGEAGVAATTIRNDLAAKAPRLRRPA